MILSQSGLLQIDKYTTLGLMLVRRNESGQPAQLKIDIHDRSVEWTEWIEAGSVLRTSAGPLELIAIDEDAAGIILAEFATAGPS